MNIFYITHTFSLDVKCGGGGEIFCSNLLKELSRQGHNIFVFTPTRQRFKEEKEFNIKVFRTPTFGHHGLHKFEYLLFYKKAIHLAKENKIDVIHAQNDVLPGIIGHLIKRKLNLPLLLSVEFISKAAPSFNIKTLYLLNKFFIPKINYDLLVSMSNHIVKNYLIPWNCDKEKIKVIPNGIDIERFKPMPPKKELIENFGKNLIISLKPLHSSNTKAIEYIIKAMQIVIKKYPNYKYLIYGSGAGKNSLMLLVKKLDLQKNVFFLDPIPYSEASRIYNSAEILVHSFVFEATMSMSLLDSMACGKPIVATDIGEIKNLIGDTAILAKPRNPESIAAGIIKLIENPSLAKELGKKVREKTIKNYSIKKVAKEFIQSYEEILQLH